MRLRTLLAVMCVAAVILATAGCVAQSARIDYASSRLHIMVAAETRQEPLGRQLNEGDVQVEVDRLLSLKPSVRVPAKLVLFEVPSSGQSKIISPRKWIELRKAVSATMKKALEGAGVFDEVDFLPDLLLPPGGASDLKTLRVAAARAHADGVLIYSTEAGYEYKPNMFAILYPTIVGLFIAPGSQEASTALSKAVLLDVKTGYIYTVLETYGDASSGITPYAYIDSEGLEFDARTQAMDALSKSVADKAKHLKE